MAHEALDSFGEILMKRVRDQAIQDWDAKITGYAKGVAADRVLEMLRTFDTAQLSTLHQLIPDIVDTTLGHLLLTLEQENSIGVSVNTGHQVVSNLREVSDGLEGELYDWIPKFSAQRYNKTFYDE
jgi:hypothetical protein